VSTDAPTPDPAHTPIADDGELPMRIPSHVDYTAPRLNLALLRHMAPRDYALRLATHPNTPIVLDGRTRLATLRIAVAEGLRIDLDDHERRATTHPGYDLAVGEERVQNARRAVELVERCPDALREILDRPYWRFTQAAQESGRVALATLLPLLDLADDAEREAIRWDHPFPVPSWVAEVRDIIATALHA
jgi:hypothetical protein